MVLNDDLQALTRIPAGLGIAAATLESDTVWGVITANANMADGLPLFHATHKNLTATNALAAVANITAARKAMRKQTAPKGTILNLIPKFLTIPAALEGIAVQITNPINLAATASSSDVPPSCAPWSRSSSHAWTPSPRTAIPTGTRRPTRARLTRSSTAISRGRRRVSYIETRQGFEVDGVEIKARPGFCRSGDRPSGLAKNYRGVGPKQQEGENSHDELRKKW